MVVLLVDDNADHLELVKRSFELAGQKDELVCFLTFSEARRWLEMNQPDIVVADLRLPDGNGLDLIEAPSLSAAVPIVIITSQGDEHQAVKAMQRGAMDYIVKTPESLRSLPSVTHRAYRQWQLAQEKKQAEERLRQHEALLNSILQTTRDGYILLDADGKFLEVNRSYANLIGYDPPELIGKTIADVEAMQTPAEIEKTIHEIQTQGALLFETRHRHRQGHWIEVEVSVTHMPQEGGKMVVFVRDIRERLAMQRALYQAKGHIERQLEEMTVLRNIDSAIISIKDHRELTYILLSQIGSMKGILAALLLTKTAQQSWSCKAAYPDTMQGRTDQLLRLLETVLSGFINNQQPLFLNQLEVPDCQALAPENEEGFSLALLPLIYTEKWLSALMICAKGAEFFDEEWQDFARALAMQTSIALSNINLYEQLSKKHQELLEAYQATLDAWSRTLEIRDKETMGHTRRVVEISLHLARALGLSEEELEVFRRGAILHDIGKINTPDAILLKPGKLNDEQIAIMRQHPLDAREMVKGIRILEEALDIPLYHHERWDGSGYPFGLKGEEIPLSARIFAVADVWDALTSDRPYRPAWTKQSVKQYILENAGRQFDPTVVAKFIELLEKGAF